jgi:hypothetical protein
MDRQNYAKMTAVAAALLCLAAACYFLLPIPELML